MRETQTDRRERSLEWIATEFFYKDGRAMAEALRDGPRWERVMAISALEEIAHAERRRGLAGHWTYDAARHTELVRIIIQERALLATKDLKAARCRYQTASRQVRRQLHCRGWAPIALLRRLGTARGLFLEAIAGRRHEENAP